jgi:hypothetical protein
MSDITRIVSHSVSNNHGLQIMPSPIQIIIIIIIIIIIM